MKAAIMQPYILPYIGYFQLIEAADVFIVYDNIKYTKKGWINRNRFLSNGSDALFSVPLKSASDSLNVVDREVSPEFAPDKLLNQLKEAYRRAPFLDSTLELLRSVLLQEERNLFGFLKHALDQTCAHIGITTPFVVSSTLDVDHTLAGQEKVIALCRAVGADTYINPIGGTTLYGHDDFAQAGIELRFLRSILSPYPQFPAEFVPWLSIIDVLMFNPPSRVLEMVKTDFELVAG